MADRFEGLPGNVRRKRLRDEKQQAEWRQAVAASEDDFGNLDHLILKLRERARRARRSAFVVLIFLLVAVFGGVGTYVVWPLLKDNFDARVGSLEGFKQDTERSLDELDERRARIVTDLKSAATLIPDLPGDVDTSFYGHADLPGEELLLYGSNNTTLRLDPDSRSATRWPDLPADGIIEYNGHAALPDGELLVYGDRKPILRLDPDSQTATPWAGLPLGTYTQYNGHAALPGGDVLVYGSHNEILRLDPDSGSVTPWPDLPGHAGAKYNGHAILPDGEMLVYGNANTILRLGDHLSRAAAAAFDTLEADTDLTSFFSAGFRRI